VLFLLTDPSPYVRLVPADMTEDCSSKQPSAPDNDKPVSMLESVKRHAKEFVEASPEEHAK
jgi:hypothetical protein